MNCCFNQRTDGRTNKQSVDVALVLNGAERRYDMFDLIKYDRRRTIKGDCRRTTIYHSTLQVSKEQQIKQNAFVLLAIKFVINRRCGLFLPIFYRIIKQDS